MKTVLYSVVCEAEAHQNKETEMKELDIKKVYKLAHEISRKNPQLKIEDCVKVAKSALLGSNPVSN